MGFEASNLTQVPLQPFCTHSRLKPHPLSNKLAIVTALGQWLPLQRARKEPHCQKWRPYMVRRPFSKPICAHEERNGPPRDDQRAFYS